MINTLINIINPEIIILFAVGIFAGSLNSVAGGGTFFTFPMLLSLGLPPVSAQVTNHIGLFPANIMALAPFISRIKQLKYQLLRSIALCGGAGVCGGLTLLLFPPVVFENIVPFLILIATILYWAEPKLKKILAQSNNQNKQSTLIVRSFQIIVAFYCGYFGAGVGFLFLLAFSLDGYDDMIDIQCLKNTVVSVITFFILIAYITLGDVYWLYAITLFIASSIGGLSGGQLIAHLSSKIIRSIVITVGLSLFIGYLLFY